MSTPRGPQHRATHEDGIADAHDHRQHDHSLNSRTFLRPSSTGDQQREHECAHRNQDVTAGAMHSCEHDLLAISGMRLEFRDRSCETGDPRRAHSSPPVAPDRNWGIFVALQDMQTTVSHFGVEAHCQSPIPKRATWQLQRSSGRAAHRTPGTAHQQLSEHPDRYR